MDTMAAALAHLEAGDRAGDADLAARHYRTACAVLGVEDASAHVERNDVLAQLGHPERRLAAYGSLRPGEAHHAEVAHLGGTWRAGAVRGRTVMVASGYEALRPSVGAHDPAVAVQVLESPALPDAWPDLDAFEGPEYHRTLVLVTLDTGQRLAAHAYVDAARATAEPPPAHP
ncbi:MAG: gamma-glutamylcyclotransferase family protein [Planctomycetota bacterium]